MSERRIPLRVSNQKAYVWDVDDIADLRAQHHVCGVLTGTLPHLSQQNVFLGVPLLLMPEEVVLLLEKQLAVLVDDPHAHRAPTQVELDRWNADRAASARVQIAAAEMKPASEVSVKAAATEAALQKRKEREARRAAAARAKSLAEGAEEDLNTPLPPPAAERSSTLAGGTPAYTVSVPVRSSSLGWYTPGDSTYSTLEDAQAAGIWTYPSDLHERAKCGVFRDLWERGNFMGGGIKFGGDYLVYPGDPLRYHSHFVATVIDSPIASLKPMEIVAHGRLGTVTKKAHLLCGWDDEKHKVSYFSIEWAGFG